MSDYDASNRKDIRKAEKFSKLRALQDREAVAAIMSTIPGRAWMWRKLEEAHIFNDPFTGDALREAYTKGERNFGQRLLSDIMAHCPDAYLQMTTEATNDRHDGNDRSTPDLSDSDSDTTPERRSSPIADGGDYRQDAGSTEGPEPTTTEAGGWNLVN